ncbi:MAG: radical SAM family heme chaperone HemW [Firmicutes bacterium]|nr:radical SAM family heme chaperone HemW [Bacillota bacterium]
MDKSPKKLGIYVHIPFCIRKCNYCDFISYPIGNGAAEKLPCGDITGYFKTLEQETRALSGIYMNWDKSSCSGNYEIDSVFFGGGTPSAVDPDLICRQLDWVCCLFNVIPGAEISLEANPGTLSEEKFRAYRLAYFNRISLGVQSLDDKVLKIMGRIHDAKEAERSFRMARKYFDNINIDLMMGVPGQTVGSWLDSLKRVLDWEPEHLSFYSLQLEEGTPFYRDYREGRLELPAWEENREMYHRGLELIKAAGYNHYEVSNAAKPGFECRHNLKYWNMEEYLGLGLAAHSFMDGKRFEAWEFFEEAGMKYPPDGSGRLSAACREHFAKLLGNISAEDENELKGDFIFTQLRLIEGLDIALYRSLFGTEFEDDFAPVLQELLDEGLLESISSKKISAVQAPGIRTSSRIAFTPEGLDKTNIVMERLLNIL